MDLDDTAFHLHTFYRSTKGLLSCGRNTLATHEGSPREAWVGFWSGRKSKVPVNKRAKVDREVFVGGERK